MRRMKRTVCLLLALAMLLTFAPMPARAAEAPAVETSYRSVTNRLHKTSRVTENMVYRDPAPRDLSEYPTSYSEAAMDLRESLMAFEENITFYIRTTEEDSWGVFEEIWAEAVAHTGNPVEGDYIDWHWIEYDAACTATYDGGDNYYAFEVDMVYVTDAQKEAEMDAAVDTLINETLPLDDSMSDYEKLKIVYDWICDNIYYDHEHVYDDTYLPQFSAHAALVERVAVCQGYSTLLYRLLLMLGIDNRFIGGYTDDGGGHAWNIVELDGAYYNVDATWDAPNRQGGWAYDWFLLSEASFVDHNRDPEYATDAFWDAYPMAAMDYVHSGDSGTSPEPGPGPVEGGCGMSEQAVYESIIALQDDYPEGMPWTNDNSYPWNINNTVGYGCAAFAFILSDEAFGYLPSRTVYDDITIDDLRVGDIIRLYNDSHSAVVLEVHDDHIVIAEGNYNYSIHWGRTLDANEVMSDITYFETRYPEHSFSGGVCTECGAVSDEPVIQWPVTGQCGENVTWTLDAYGVLTISGTGNMYGYLDRNAEWYEYADLITSVVVEEGVTRLGGYAFRDCVNLSFVSLPITLTAVGECVFLRCEDNIDVFFYGDAPSFAAYAFNLNHLTCSYPLDNDTWTADVMRSYGGQVQWLPFGDAEPEPEPDIWPVSGQCGDDVYWTLYEDGLLDLTGTGATWDFHEENPEWSAYADHVRYVVFGNGITRIGAYLLYGCANLEWAQVDASVESVGISAFAQCPYLAEVDFLGGAPAFEGSTFFGDTVTCRYPANDPSWTSDVLHDHGGDVTWEPVGGGSDYVAEGQCGDDVYWNLDEDGFLYIYGTGDTWDYPVEYPGWYDFMNYLVYAVVEEGVTGIGDYFFCDTDGLLFVQLPASLTSVGERAFGGSYSGIGVEFLGDVPAIAPDAFYGREAFCIYPVDNSTWTADVMGDYEGSIEWMSSDEADTITGQCGDNVFWELNAEGFLFITGTGDMWDYSNEYPGWYDYVESVRYAFVDEGVTSIGHYAFFDCSSLEEIYLPESLAAIETEAFAYCYGLNHVEFAGDAPRIAHNAFYDVETLCYYPAGNATWTEAVMTDYEGALEWVPVEDEYETWPAAGQCGDDLFWELDEDGLLTIFGTGDMWDYPEDYPGWYSYVDSVLYARIEEGVTSIGEFAFFDCYNMESISVAASVSRLGGGAFSYCYGLTTVDFLGDAPQIARDAFFDVTAACTYPAENATWTENVMADYEGYLTWIPMGDEGVVWPVTGQCGDNVYWTLSEDGLLVISGSGEMWDYPEQYPGWYYYADILTEAVIEPGITAIGEFAFYECGNLRAVTIPDTVAEIRISAFNRTALETVTIPDSVMEIGHAAFYSTSLTSVTIPASVEEIGDYAFEDCTDLTEIRFEGDAPAFGEDIFAGVTAECTYPAGNDTWTADVMRNYGGSLTWLVPEEPGLAGDLNGDGTVNSDDAIYLLYYTLFGDIMYPVSGDCDYNGDGAVNSDDAIYLLYYTLFGDIMYPLN